MFGVEEDGFNMSGQEFSVGLVRGRHLGGDWGISFIDKTVKDGVVLDRTGSRRITNGVSLLGVEIHKFVPFTTIQQRVQIGMKFSGGVGRFRGDLGGEDAKFLFAPGGVARDPVPIAKVALAIAGIVAPGVKLRASGGFNFPGYQFGSVEIVYLFGAR